MRQLLFIFALLSMVSKAQTIPKLMTYGEHLGYKMEYFKGEQSFESGVLQGERWQAVYCNNNIFQVREEKINWDTTQNFTFQSDSSVQPLFYFQGLPKPNKKGISVDLHSRVWNFADKKYCAIYKNDSVASKIKAESTNELNLITDTILFYCGVKNKIIDGSQNLIHWAGDINGDNEVDFIILTQEFADNIILDLIISEKSKGKTIWKRFARFNEWS